MALKVETWTDPATWDTYVRGDESASNYHQWVWKQIIEETYGHSTYYLAATRDSAIQGVLPLVLMKSWLFGDFLVSLPYFNYGGVLSKDAEAQEALLARAAAVARESGAKHIELRQGAASAMEWQSLAAKVAMIVPLPKTVDELWKNLNSRLRNKVRSARKSGFEIRWGGGELVPAFYSVFAANMRNLGTPVYPRAWFENILRLVGPQARILTLWDGDTPVAATLVVHFRDLVELPWIASAPEGRKRYSTVLLYWTALEWALQNSYSRVDLGRCTPGGGVYEFKRQWDCTEVPLHWYYWLAPGVPMPHLRPDNPKYRLAVRVWQRLPLFVANWIGPRIVRSIP